MKTIFPVLMVLVPLAVGVLGCSEEEDDVAGAAGAGQAGSSAGGSSAGGSSGAGGSDAGAGGSDAGSGGSDAGAGGSDAGAGGSDAGAGGSDAGAAGSDAGAGGSDAGSGGSDAGAGGSDAGAGGSDAGAGGSTAGSGGAAGSGGGQVVTTGEACGATPILGAQGTNNTEVCVSCMDDACCDQGAACGANADCKALRECFATCGTDSACSTKCSNDYPAGVKLNDAVAACRRTTCGAQCANFACVGNLTPVAPTKENYTFTVKPKDFQSGKALPNVKINVCAMDDLECATPLTTATTDASGAAQLTAKAGVNGIEGYFEFTGGGIVPTNAFFKTVNLTKEFDGGEIVPLLLSTSTFGLLTSVISVSIDPERGSVIFSTQDCSRLGTAGISVAVPSADAKSTLTYIKGSLPSKTETQTDPSGAGAVLNLPLGPFEITGTIVHDGTVIGKHSGFVRKGYLSSVNVEPMP